MKKIISLTLITICILALLIGCQSNEEGDTTKNKIENPDLHILFWAKDLDDDRKQAAEIFEDRFGGKVTFTGVASYEEYVTQITSLYSSGESPDWVGLYEHELSPLMEKGILQDITTYIDINDKNYYDKDVMSFCSIDNKYYGLANTPGAAIIYYNKRLFENAGEKTPTEYFEEGTWNWENFLKVGRNMTIDNNNDGTIDQWGFATYMYNTIIRSNDGMYITKKPDNKYEITIKNKNTTNALKFLQDIYVGPDRIAKFDAASWDNDFINGVTAMLGGVTWMAELKFKNMEDEFGIVPYPYGPDVDKKTAAGTENWYQSAIAGCKNPEGFVEFYKILSDIYKKREKERDPVWKQDHIAMFDKMKGYKIFSGEPTAVTVNSSFIWNPIVLEGKSVSQTQEKMIPYFESLLKAKTSESQSSSNK